MITDWATTFPVKGVAQLSGEEDMEGIGRPVAEEALEEEMKRQRRVLVARSEQQEWQEAWRMENKGQKRIKEEND